MIFARHGYFKKLYPTVDPHIHPVNTSNLQQNMVSPTQQAAHAIFEVAGKQKEPWKPLRACLIKIDDPYTALMIYHSTQLHSGLSSSKFLMNRWLCTTLQFLMNRRLCTTLPILESQLQPSISEYSVVCEKETMRKLKPTVRKFLVHVIEQIL